MRYPITVYSNNKNLDNLCKQTANYNGTKICKFLNPT